MGDVLIPDPAKPEGTPAAEVDPELLTPRNLNNREDRLNALSTAGFGHRTASQ